MEDFNVRAVKINHFDFSRTEEIDEYRIFFDDTFMAKIQVRYNNRTKKTDYRAYGVTDYQGNGVEIKGRAQSWTSTEDEAINRIKRAAQKVE